MTKRLLLSYLTVTLVVLVLLEVPAGVYYGRRERDRLTSDVVHDATTMATYYEDDLELDNPLDPAPAQAYWTRTGARVVIISTQGVSLVDTESDVGRDFSSRPEVARALTGATNSGTRRSETLGTDLLFVAVPVASGGDVHGVVRLTLDTSDVETRVHRLWLSLAGVAAIVLAAVTLIGFAIARSVTRPVRRLRDDAARFASGDLSVDRTPHDGPPEIRALGESLDAMAARLDDQLRSQRAFVADASHQLRTPLTALRLRLENIEAELPPGRSEELGAAIEETDRLANLVAEFLSLARTDEHRPPIEIDLVPLLSDRVDTWTAVAESGGIRLVLDVGPPPPAPARALAIPGGVEQMLDNLLDNAIEAVTSAARGEDGDGGEIGIRLVRLDGRFRVDVIDHGPGLDDNQKTLALKRFWRGEAQHPGTGLGLTIVEGLAAASGGSLMLGDTPEGGLTASVTLLAAPRAR